MRTETNQIWKTWNEDFEAGLRLWDPMVDFCNNHKALKPVARWIETNQSQARGFERQKLTSKLYDNHPAFHGILVAILEAYPPVLAYDYVNKYRNPDQGILGHELAEATYRFFKNLEKTPDLHAVEE